jgi:hypothetical protein
MLGMDKKKKEGLAIIIANGLAKDKSSDGEEYAVEKESAAEEVLAAIESKDPKALAESLGAMIELCSNVEDAEESEEEKSY